MSVFHSVIMMEIQNRFGMINQKPYAIADEGHYKQPIRNSFPFLVLMVFAKALEAIIFRLS